MTRPRSVLDSDASTLTPLPIAPASPRRWRLADVAAAVFFVAFLGLQVIVPLVKLAAPRPARFAWHMYSDFLRTPRMVLVFHDSTVTVDPKRHVTHVRADLDLARHLPAHLCAINPEATAIVVTARGSEPVERPCLR